jgi:hypothetical protein
MNSIRFRKILVLGILFLLPVSSLAEFQVGILGGLAVTGSTLNSGSEPNLLSSSSQPSYKIGVEGDYDLLPGLLGVELNVLYAKYKWEQTTIGAALPVDFSTSWWEVPIFFNYTGLPGFKFGIGPVFDFSSGEVNSQNSDGSNSLSQTYAAAGFGGTSVSIALQTGMAYPIKAGWSADVDLRYMMGITNLQTGANHGSVKIHSFDLLVGAGYAF